ncbi:MAG TPA: hypothetical protein VM284_03895 [Candidatus Limnocylindria bacterium]|nr:hypothetical protein [Candidatus Limnocylindria bacterium]
MSKKTRGSGRTHHRPGTRPATDRAVAPRRPLGAAPIDLAGAADEPREDQPEASEEEIRPVVARETRTHHRVKAGSLLAARAATEYVYVAKDMRRILFVAAFLVAIMLVLWLLLVVMRVVPLPFY